MSAQNSNPENEMPEATENSGPEGRQTIVETAAAGGVEDPLLTQKEIEKSREAEASAFRQLDILKSRIFDLEGQLVELKSEVQNERASSAATVARLEEERNNVEAAFSAERRELGRELAQSAKKYATLESRYVDRLADIAELGHAISRREDDLSRLKSQQEYSVLRNHILTKLTPNLTKLHRALSKPFFSKARRRMDNAVAKETAMIADSGLFDAEWYCETYPDVAQSGGDPLRHFVLNGAYELRDPGPAFSAYKYHQKYPDVTEAGIPALLHFLRNGRSEGRLAFRVGEGA